MHQFVTLSVNLQRKCLYVCKEKGNIQAAGASKIIFLSICKKSAATENDFFFHSDLIHHGHICPLTFSSTAFHPGECIFFLNVKLFPWLRLSWLKPYLFLCLSLSPSLPHRPVRPAWSSHRRRSQTIIIHVVILSLSSLMFKSNGRES